MQRSPGEVPTPTRSPPWPLTNELQVTAQSNILPTGRTVFSASFRVPAHFASTDSIIPYDRSDTPVTIVPIDVSRRSSWSSLSAAENKLSDQGPHERIGQVSIFRPQRPVSEPRATPSPHGVQLQAHAASVRPSRRSVQQITLPHRQLHTSAGFAQHPQQRPPIPARSSSLIKQSVRPLRASVDLPSNPPPRPLARQSQQPTTADHRPIRHPLRSPLSSVPIPYPPERKHGLAPTVRLVPPSSDEPPTSAPPTLVPPTLVPPTPFPSEGRLSRLIMPPQSIETTLPPWTRTLARRAASKLIVLLSSIVAFASLTLSSTGVLSLQTAPYALACAAAGVAVAPILPPQYLHPASLFFLAVFNTLCGCAPNDAALVVGRALTGVASALTLSSSLALSSTISSSPWTLNLSAAAETTILPLGLVLGLVTTQGFSVHAIANWNYWTLAIIAIILSIPSGVLFSYTTTPAPKSPSRRRQRFQIFAALAISAGLVFTLGPTLAATLIASGWTNVYLPFMLAVGVTILIFTVPISRLPAFDAWQAALRRAGLTSLAVTAATASLAGPLLSYRALRPAAQPPLTSALELLALPAAAFLTAKTVALVLAVIVTPASAKHQRPHRARLHRRTLHLAALAGLAMMTGAHAALALSGGATFWSLPAVWVALTGGGLGLLLTAAHACALGVGDRWQACAGAYLTRGAEALGLGLGSVVAANLEVLGVRAVVWGGLGWSGAGVVLVVLVWLVGTVQAWRGGGDDDDAEGV